MRPDKQDLFNRVEKLSTLLKDAETRFNYANGIGDEANKCFNLKELADQYAEAVENYYTALCEELN